MIALHRWHWCLAFSGATAVHLLLIAGWINLTGTTAAPPLALSPVPSPLTQISAMTPLEATAELDLSEPFTAPAPSVPSLSPPQPAAPPSPESPSVEPPPLGTLQLAIDTRLPQVAQPAAMAPARPKTVYEQAEVDQVPTGRYQPPPDYPLQARRRQLTGLVLARLLIDPLGQVAQVVIVSAEPKGVFESAVQSALRRWTFEPGRVGGRAVSTWVEVPVRFELKR